MVVKALAEMNDYAQKGHTPKVKMSKACNACSLQDVCLPESENLSAKSYIKKAIEEK